MRIAVLSDIHANALALKAVLEDAHRRDVESYWCLGDVVGYGPRPVPPVLWLKLATSDWVLGNHDAMLANLLKPEEWAAVNEAPKKAIALNREALRADEEADSFWQAEFTRERAAPRLHRLDGVDYMLVHSSQSDHLGISRYIYDWQTDFLLPSEFKALYAQANARGCPRVQWYGHTHVPTLVFARPKNRDDEFEFRAVKIIPGEEYRLDGDLALINPGSVGQPRDLDQRAAYAVLDTGARTVAFWRAAYDWQESARALRQSGYPESLVRRLRDAPAVNETPDQWVDHYQRAREAAL